LIAFRDTHWFNHRHRYRAGGARAFSCAWAEVARPRAFGRDKAKVEAAVLIIERWILARLRHQRFYSLTELNAAIRDLLKRLNDNA
jgi:hypothetical protein